MGSSHSLMGTVVGQSLINRKFRTRPGVCFEYSGNDRRYYVGKWEDRPAPINPHENTFQLKVKIPIEFKITDVIKTWGIDAGYWVQVRIQILNNFPIDAISVIREGTVMRNWVDRQNITDIRSPFLPARSEMGLLTAKIEGICSSRFGFRFRSTAKDGVDPDTPCWIDPACLTEI